MKKLILLFLASASFVSVFAQEKKNIGMIGKISATWCNPCGTWGWDLMNTEISTNSAYAFPLSMFPDNGTTYNNNDFYNAANVALANAITFNGFPSFSANAKDVSLKNTNSNGTINTVGVKADIDAALAAFAAAPVVASSGVTYKITGNTIEVTTNTKFWAAASGTYNVAVYLLENASHIQNGQTGAVTHHNVFRTTFSSSVWGDQIATGSINTNQTYSKTFTYTLSGNEATAWDKTKFQPVVIIWKKNGTKWDYVNGTESYSYVFATDIPTVSNMNSMALYPNPAVNEVNLSVALDKAAPATITVTDIVGRVVYNSGELQFNNGRNQYLIPTSDIPSGVYNVTIRSNDNVLTQRLSIAK